jgi:hypothetical protein
MNPSLTGILLFLAGPWIEEMICLWRNLTNYVNNTVANTSIPFGTRKKKILDFSHRSQMPLWWKACSIIGLDADIQHPVYRRFLLNKIYTWCPESGFGTVMMDKPMVENKYKNAIKYQNSMAVWTISVG